VRPCSVCASPQREAIELELLAGTPLRHIAESYRVNRRGLGVHRDEHLPATMSQAHRAAEVAHADTLLERLEALEQYVVGILAAAANGTHEPIAGPFAPQQIPSTAGGVVLPHTALQAAREYRGVLELYGRLAGQLDDGSTAEVIVTFSPEWRTGS
jgi:hypothetical protein